MNPTSLKQLFQQIANASMPQIVIGVVVSEDPLKIVLKDDIGVRLSSVSLIIPSGKKPLQKDEELYMLSVSNNKIYYVLDRV